MRTFHQRQYAIGGAALVFYLFRELLARHLKVLHDYQVELVRTLADGLTEFALRPLDQAMSSQAGQWMMLHVEAKDGWHRHPFATSSAPHEPLLRVTVKALGDDTERAHLPEPGMSAVLRAPHGPFRLPPGRRTSTLDWRRDRHHTFLIWLRDADHRNLQLPQIDLFYTNPGPAPFRDEITAIANRHSALRLHLTDTSAQPRLHSEQILAATAAEFGRLSVYMCGPTPMLRDLRRRLTTAGVPHGQVRQEHFDWR